MSDDSSSIAIIASLINRLDLVEAENLRLKENEGVTAAFQKRHWELEDKEAAFKDAILSREGSKIKIRTLQRKLATKERTYKALNIRYKKLKNETSPR